MQLYSTSVDIYLNGVIIAQTTAGNIIAVSQSCTHQGPAVQYQGGNDRMKVQRTVISGWKYGISNLE